MDSGKKKDGTWDNELILDDGHDTPMEEEIKNSRTLAQWREGVMRLKAERDREAQAGESKPPIERSREDEDDFLKER